MKKETRRTRNGKGNYNNQRKRIGIHADRPDMDDHVRDNDRISYDVYNLELVIAVAFRIDSRESRAFREFIMQSITHKTSNQPQLICL